MLNRTELETLNNQKLHFKILQNACFNSLHKESNQMCYDLSFKQ